MKRLVSVLVIVFFLIVGWSSLSYSEDKNYNNPIEELHKKVLTIPASDIIKNLSFYRLLRELDPNNTEYIKKCKFYFLKAQKVDQQRFQDHVWGSSFDEVKETLVSKGHKPRTVIGYDLRYDDNILGEKVSIDFNFTPTTKKLFMVYLTWESKSVFKSLIRILTNKYGPPDIEEDYSWGPSIRLSLDEDKEEYKFITTLWYTSTKFILLQFEDERKKIAIEDEETKDMF